MATRMTLSQSRAFLPEPSEPSVPWDQWHNAFANYLLAIGGESYSNDRKKAILLHCLGLEGQRIYHTLPEDSTGRNPYSKATNALKEHFMPYINPVSERKKFRRRSQNPGESIDAYLASLRDLAKPYVKKKCSVIKLLIVLLQPKFKNF